MEFTQKFTFPDDIVICGKQLLTGRKLVDFYISANIPDRVTVHDPSIVRRTAIYLGVSGYVPLSAFIGVGLIRDLYSRHNHIVHEFDSAVFGLFFVGQSSHHTYARCLYDSSSKRYHVCSFFQVDIHDVSR